MNAVRILSLAAISIFVAFFSVQPVCCTGNYQADLLMRSIVNHELQDRTDVVCNHILSSSAKARALDMATRNYVSHTNPDGFGPNRMVSLAGYPLPDYYDTSDTGNNIESIAAGYIDAEAALGGWLRSESHRVHLLGSIVFFEEQTQIGVGYAYNPDSDYQHYWVFLSAYGDEDNCMMNLYE